MPTFFDPHPGFAGAAIPIPPQVKKVADGLNGQIMSLQTAVRKIQYVTQGKVKAVPDPRHGFIGLTLRSGDTTHFFRVIRYR
ncbi:MAG: hypothetical protein Q8P76_01860 [bacterium]|nr:hypothetical protein [bacterium]